MNKLGVFIITILLTPVLAGLYGILHDQLTYTICREYYTKFKFIQFGFWDKDGEAILPNPRLSVAAVGFLATWWTGILIGPGLALTGLIHSDSKLMAKIIYKATLITLSVTMLTGLAGLAYGKFYLAQTGVNWWLPDNLIDKQNFIAVESMHNFSYLGGLLGLLLGIIYQIQQKINFSKKETIEESDADMN